MYNAIWLHFKKIVCVILVNRNIKFTHYEIVSNRTVICSLKIEQNYSTKWNPIVLLLIRMIFTLFQPILDFKLQELSWYFLFIWIDQEESICQQTWCALRAFIVRFTKENERTHAIWEGENLPKNERLKLLNQNCGFKIFIKRWKRGYGLRRNDLH
jgi:hypothetical protein